MVPTTVEEANELNKKNADIYWRDVIRKGEKNVIVAFKILDPSEQVPVGQIEGAQARLVADRHSTSDPADSTYAGVASRETVWIALTYAALHSLGL